MLSPMQYARQGFAAVGTGSQVLVWGELSGHSGAWVTPPHGEAFNPETNSWTALLPWPLHGRMVAVAFWNGRRLIVSAVRSLANAERPSSMAQHSHPASVTSLPCRYPTSAAAGLPGCSRR
jgi:hypothetical protein